MPKKASEGKPGLAGIFNSVLSHMARFIPILQMERLKLTDLIEMIPSRWWDPESKSGRQVAPKLLEQNFSTMGPWRNASTRGVPHPAVCWTVPCKSCPMQNASGTPDKKQRRRALAGEGRE